MAAKNVTKAAYPAWRITLARWAYSKSYFPELGLRYEDTWKETPVIQEALKRLPKPVYDERSFRIVRALMLSNTKTVLPKEEWTKPEEDESYLQKYIDEVQKEWDEKKEWEKQ